jgi:SAM-dependent methyltransferase
MAGPSRYIHGSTDDEQRRLTGLNEYLNARYVPELRLRPGERVLDLASGLGQLSRAIARAVQPGGAVVGIERDPRQLAQARAQAAAAGEDDLVEWREGDVDAVPLAAGEQGTFDVAHARFLLEHVPDPQAVVHTMARAVRRGGRVLLADDDHAILRLWPRPPLFLLAWDAFVESFRLLGNDPDVGCKLPALLHAAGLQPVRIASVFVGACAGSEDFPFISENFARLIEGARDVVLQTQRIGAAELNAAFAEYERWRERPDAALWYAFQLAEGVRP